MDDAQRFEESEAGVFFGASSNAGVTSLQKKGGGWSEERQIIGKEGRGLGYCCWFRAEETRHRAFNRVSRTISYLRKQRCKWGVARFSFPFVSFRFVDERSMALLSLSLSLKKRRERVVWDENSLLLCFSSLYFGSRKIV